MQEIAEMLDDTGTDKTLDTSTERLKTVADSLRKRLDQQTSMLDEWVEVTEDMNKLQNWVEQTQKGLEKPEEHVNVREQLQKKEVRQLFRFCYIRAQYHCLILSNTQKPQRYFCLI